MQILDDMERLLRLFSTVCSETSTMEKLLNMMKDRKSWPKAKSLFNAIREKHLKRKSRKTGNSKRSISLKRFARRLYIICPIQEVGLIQTPLIGSCHAQFIWRESKGYLMTRSSRLLPNINMNSDWLLCYAPKPASYARR